MLTIHDIDIFVLSYNRKKYLLETIQSLRQQTIGSFQINILDNGSNDGTEQSIEALQDACIKFFSSEKNYGALWNFQRAQNLASKKYVILFHDDDLIHPYYLEYILKVLNTNTNVSLVCSGMKVTSVPDQNDWKKYKCHPLIFHSLSLFTSLVYLGFPLNFASVVYKTKILKKAKIDFEQYGKIADRPLVFDCARDGNIALFAGQYIQYRVHANQDSKNNKSGPFPNQTTALHVKYKKIIFQENKLLSKLFFLINFYKYIVEEYSRFINSDYSQKQYIKEVVKQTGISKQEFYLSKIFYFMRLTSLYKMYRFFKRKFGQYS